MSVKLVSENQEFSLKNSQKNTNFIYEYLFVSVVQAHSLARNQSKNYYSRG